MSRPEDKGGLALAPPLFKINLIGEYADRLHRRRRAHVHARGERRRRPGGERSAALGRLRALAGAQVLQQKERTAEQYDEFVGGVQDQLRQLVRLVDSLLTLARADAGFPLAQTQPVSMNEIVMEAVERCEPLARHREIRLVPILAPPTDDGVEAVVSGDPALLRAVVDNLIRNAVRYSPIEEAVEIELCVDGQAVLVAVRDKGPGIPPEELDRVFDRFFHIPRGDEAVPGAGLGLAIARGVATLHHGSIAASNRLEGGCEFVLRLPVFRSDEGTSTGSGS